MNLNNTIHRPTRLGKSKCKWQNPELSVGLFYRKMGRSSCWEAVGAAKATFLQMADEVKDYLEKNGNELSHEVRKSAHDQFLPFIRLFMCALLATYCILAIHPTGLVWMDCLL